MDTCMWNKNEIKGKGKQISGAIKDKTGELIKDPKLEAKGEAERVAGKLQQTTGKARRKTADGPKRLPASYRPAITCLANNRGRRRAMNGRS